MQGGKLVSAGILPAVQDMLVPAAKDAIPAIATGAVFPASAIDSCLAIGK